MKCIEKIVSALTSFDKRGLVMIGREAISGNYAVKYTVDDFMERVGKVTYHGNVIATVYNRKRVFVLDDCGYTDYMSTRRCIRDLYRQLTTKGYTYNEEKSSVGFWLTKEAA